MQGKIIKGIAGFYYVHDGHSRIYECKAKGAFRNQKVKPLVGDNVDFDVLDDQKMTGNIIKILPRKNALIRPASANIDQALVVFAGREPDPNLNLLDRFLVMMERQGIPCLICFSKDDLLEKGEEKRLADRYKGSGCPVLFLCARENQGVEQVRNLLSGKTTVLAGPSGVGKSTLMNVLKPDAEMETGQVSEKIKRGKHTTRHAQLFCLEDGTFLMDTPGFSSMDIEDMPCEELRFYFPEFDPYEGTCRFLGCIHDREPGCRVKEAVSGGIISRERYESYIRLYQDLKDRKRY